MIIVKGCQCNLNYLQSYLYLVNVKLPLVIDIRYLLSDSGSLSGIKWPDVAYLKKYALKTIAGNAQFYFVRN